MADTRGMLARLRKLERGNEPPLLSSLARRKSLKHMRRQHRGGVATIRATCRCADYPAL